MVMDFETHIMPRLAKEYVEHSEKKVPFDLQKLRNLGRDNKEGFAMQTWDQIDLQDNVNTLVSKGLIEDLGDGNYQISNLALNVL
jgi:hypothetical protein